MMCSVYRASAIAENALQVQDLLLFSLLGYFKYSEEVRILANGLECVA